jgi:hypothetical protein
VPAADIMKQMTPALAATFNAAEIRFVLGLMAEILLMFLI